MGIVVDKAVFKTRSGFGPGYYIVSIIAQIILGVLAAIIVAWYSRRREFRADAGGAGLAGREKWLQHYSVYRLSMSLRNFQGSSQHLAYRVE